MKKIITAIIIFILIMPVFPFNIAGSYSDAEFTLLMMDGFGARRAGLGGVYTALADDISALTTNPAGLGIFNKREIGMTYSFYPLGLNFINFGIGLPLQMKKHNLGTFGTGFSMLLMKKFEELDSSGFSLGDRLNTFEVEVTGSYALDLFKFWDRKESLSIGVNIKFLSDRIVNENRYGIAFDFGILYRMGMYGFNGSGWSVIENGLTFGTVFNNLGFSKVFGAEIKLPWDFKAGLSYTGIDAKNHRLLAALEFTLPNDSRPALGIALEYTIFKMLSFRAGFNILGKEGELVSFGIGGNFKLKKVGFKIDYSITPVMRIGLMHSGSVSIYF